MHPCAVMAEILTKTLGRELSQRALQHLAQDILFT
jgi:hypothetical protein